MNKLNLGLASIVLVLGGVAGCVEERHVTYEHYRSPRVYQQPIQRRFYSPPMRRVYQPPVVRRVQQPPAHRQHPQKGHHK